MCKGLWAFFSWSCFSDADWLVGKLQSRGAHGSKLGSIEGLFLTLGLCDHVSLGYTTVLCHQAHHGPHYSDTPALGLLCWWRLEVSHSTLVESGVQNLMITNPKSPNLSWRNRRWTLREFILKSNLTTPRYQMSTSPYSTIYQWLYVERRSLPLITAALNLSFG